MAQDFSKQDLNIFFHGTRWQTHSRPTIRGKLNINKLCNKPKLLERETDRQTDRDRDTDTEREKLLNIKEEREDGKKDEEETRQAA